MTDRNRRKDRLISDLRTGAIDKFILHGLTRSIDSFDLSEESFIRSIEEYRNALTGTSGQPKSNKPSTTSPLRHPRKEIARFFAKRVLVDQLFAYLSRFSRTDPEEIAQTYECLEAEIFLQKENSMDAHILSRRLKKRELNFFRLAQKIRNDFGTLRKKSLPMCLRSFEDITQVEEELRNGETSNFLFQLVALKIVDRRHASNMFNSLSARSQVLAFHEELNRIYPFPSCASHRYRRYFKDYELAFENKDSEPPTWKELEKFLRSHGSYGEFSARIFRTRIVDAELDGALNCFLNFLVRMLSGSPFFFFEVLGITIRRLEEFLVRGATLFFKHPDEQLSSLGALGRLLKMVDVRRPYGYKHILSSLEGLSEYICCSVSVREDRLEFDNERIVPLTCLAARKVVTPESDRELPHKLRSFIGAHRELRWELQRELWSEDGGARYAGFEPPFDDIFDGKMESLF